MNTQFFQFVISSFVNNDALLKQIISIRQSLGKKLSPENKANQFQLMDNFLDSLTYPQKMKYHIQKFISVLQQIEKVSSNIQIKKNIFTILDVGFFILNFNAFLFTIENLADSQQKSQWFNLFNKGIIYGAYAQTQLGHGSNIKQIQSTATLDIQTDSFILNTPNIRATKFWAGLLGFISTHCIFNAHTYVKDKYIGIQTFLLPIKDIKTFQVLQNIKVGDIGAKLGYNTTDNGFLILQNKKIPRRNMLMKYVQVSKDGKVTGLEDKNSFKYSYGSMLNLRVLITLFQSTAMVMTSYLLYNHLQIEKKLTNINRIKISEGIAIGIGYVLANRKVLQYYNKFKQASLINESQKKLYFFKMTHVHSACFKALSSWDLMKFLGQNTIMDPFGHYYCSGQAKFFVDFLPSVTYEGDNSTMIQEVVQYLMKQKGDVFEQKGQKSNQMKKLQKFYQAQYNRIRKMYDQKIMKGHNMKKIWEEQMQVQLIHLGTIWGQIRKFQLSEQQINKIEIGHLKSKFSKLRIIHYQWLLKNLSNIRIYIEQQLNEYLNDSELQEFKVLNIRKNMNAMNFKVGIVDENQERLKMILKKLSKF